MKLHISISLVGPKGKGKAKKKKNYIVVNAKPTARTDSAALDKRLSWHSPGQQSTLL